MYTIVADSGSTKTDWVILDNNGLVIYEAKTIGINPYFHSEDNIKKELQKSFNDCKVSFNEIEVVHFYGAGCSSLSRISIVRNAFAALFEGALININHDLEGAAIATLGDQDGVACILGTGSNSCQWIGGEVKSNIPSHGYVFGDEGSGAALGIKLLKLYLGDRLTEAIKIKFEKTFQLSKDQILFSTYKGQNPNVFLASFAKFLTDNMTEPQIEDILEQGFKEFFQTRVVPYEGYQTVPLGFVGSVAYSHRDVLMKVAESFGCLEVTIIQSPIDGLVNYHQNKLANV